MRLDDSYFPCQQVTGSPVIRRADNLSTHLIGLITLGLWVVQSVASCAQMKVIAATRRNFQRSWLADAYLLPFRQEVQGMLDPIQPLYLKGVTQLALNVS